MRKSLILAFVVVLGSASGTARAAFVSCEDARNYGENSARLFVGQSFARISCNADLLPRVHFALDRVLSRQVLRTSDSDEEKACFYEGMFEGLLSQLSTEYAECTCDARFQCLSGDTVSSHIGSLISALNLSLLDPDALGVDGVVSVFESAAAPLAVPLCSPVDAQTCASAVLRSMSTAAQQRFAPASEPLGELLCGS